MPVNPELKPCPKSSLGKVIMPDDLPLPVKMPDEAKKDRAFLVTSDGDMVTPEGLSQEAARTSFRESLKKNRK